MIKIEFIETYGWEAAFRGLRNPKESWSKGDSVFSKNDTIIGENDLKLARALILSGSDHAKFTRQIGVSMDITAPLYWFKEFDQYKIGTTTNSTSTMHKLATTPITKEHFSFDDVDLFIENKMINSFDGQAMYVKNYFEDIIDYCENLREKYLQTQDIRYWRALIQLMPSAWNQKRTVTLNYQVLRNMYLNRKNHKLSEWHDFCDMIDKLPYSSDLISIKRS